MDTIKQLSFFTIDLMKSAINHDENLSGKARELLLQTGKEFDRCKVNNEPTSEIEYQREAEGFTSMSWGSEFQYEYEEI